MPTVGVISPEEGASWKLSGLGRSNSMSPIRGDVKKKSFPSSPRGDGRCGLHPVRSQLWRGGRLAAYSGQTRRLAVCTRRFHDAIVVDAYGSGSYASRRVGFSGPTMVLFETRGLQLSLVMRGGIGCIWRLGAERQHAGPNSLMDTLPRPRASQEPIG